jgi:L-lactate dehydrogenase complex protein LldE
MRIGLFIPCYIDQFFPAAGIAALHLLQRYAGAVVYPAGQTCCGQPWANAGLEGNTAGLARHFARLFGEFDYVVSPSSSCVHHVRDHYAHMEQTEAMRHVRTHCYELTDFLTEVLHIDRVKARFPHRVALHPGCHGLRGLRNGRASELMIPPFSRAAGLLSSVEDLQLVGIERPDECCGFGGTFSVKEEAVSAAMGHDKLRSVMNSGAEYVTATDMSCLMHLDGLARREGLPVRCLHIAEILNSEAR